MTIGIRHDIKGYAYAEFEDSDGRRCNMAESTTDGYLWLGHENDGPRMHLDQEKLRALLPLLQHFASEAELLYPPDHGEDTVHEPAGLVLNAEPANGRIRLDMREPGQPGQIWQLTEAQARAMVLALAVAIDGREMTVVPSEPGEQIPLAGIVHASPPCQHFAPAAERRLIGVDLGSRTSRASSAVMVPCDRCDGTGTLTPDGGHGRNGTDICGRCGGEGRILASSGETATAAFDPATGGYVGDREGGR